MLFRGATLHTDSDEALQALVDDAADACGAPIALVSLVLDRIQFFRAHRGLPPDLVLAQATDRDVSFCQLVVKTGEPLEANDAELDPDLPQALVDQYGIRSYFGVPVHIRDEVAGTLCVIDTVPRSFSEEERGTVAQLAQQVEQRLAVLDTKPNGPLEVAAQSAFAELRNALVPFPINLSLARMALAEMGPIARIMPLLGTYPELARTLTTLTRASDAIGEMQRIVEELEGSLGRLMGTMGALEVATTSGNAVTQVSDMIKQAEMLALHITRLAGGVWWPPVSPELSIRVERQQAILEMSAALIVLATLSVEEQFSAGITVQIDDLPRQVVITLFGAEVPAAVLRERLAGLVDGASQVTVNNGAIRLCYPVT